MALLCALLTFVLLSAAAKGRHLMFDQPSSRLAGRLPALAKDNTVILTQASCGYLEFADNWAVHMESLEIDNWLMVAEDITAQQYLSERQAPCFAPAGVGDLRLLRDGMLETPVPAGTVAAYLRVKPAIYVDAASVLPKYATLPSEPATQAATSV